MAYIEQKEDDPNERGLGVAPSGDKQGPLVGGSSNQVGQGVSQAGVGSGGSGWTNIQAYLKANDGNTQSADALNKDVGGAFNQEKSTLDSKANETRTQADAWNKAPSIDDAMNDYSGAAQTMKNFLNQSYGGPKTFDYGMGGKTQNYGDALGTNEGWQGLVNSLYDRSAGGAMSSGQRTLQQQLDVNNPLLAQTQNNLWGQYNQLKDYASSTAKDTSDYLQGAEGRRQQGQQDTRNEFKRLADDAWSTANDYRNKGETWNEAKWGPVQDQIDYYDSLSNRYRDFLGMGSTDGGGKPKAAGEKKEDKYIDPLTGQPLNVQVKASGY